MMEEVHFSVAVTERDGVVDEPRVIDVLVDLGHVAALLGVHGQHLVEELEQSWREVLPHARRLGRCSALPLHELVVVGIAECGLLPRKTPGQHAEQEDAERPDVARWIHVEADVVGGVADLGRCVGDAAAHSRDVYARA